MTLLHRSLVAIAISASLAGCYTDTEATVPMPENPEPLLPLDPKDISLQIGDSTIDAMEESVVITTLEGEEKRVNVETFKGIGYATQSRFEHSVVSDVFAGNIDATEFGAACMQVRDTFVGGEKLAQSEDCLNLNIWRPVDVEAGADLPVYVFIHGGNFEYGAGSDDIVHGDTIVAQGVDGDEPFIYVSINYRLGQLGTQWVESDEEDGNYGIGDQKRALEWVHNHIAEFGGNTTNVTVIGQGAGAMSIGFLQQDDNIAGTYFQQAIMQSNAYGFQYPSYDVAKDRNQDFDENTSREEIMASQKTALGGIEQLKNWLLSSLQVPVLSPKADDTPMSTLMPYAPYIGCDELEDQGLFVTKWVCVEHTETPIASGLSVPTVLGTNANEANSSGMLFSVTFLIPFILENWPDSTNSDEPAQMALDLIEWLDDERNVALVENKLANMSANDVSTELTIPSSAYSAVTGLFFGAKLNISGDSEQISDCVDIRDIPGTIGCLVDVAEIDILSHQQTRDLLDLTDFYPKSEAALGDAIDNMGKFKTLLNDTLFDGPARHMAATSENAATLYRFDKKPSFNVYNYNTGENGSLDILDLFKTIGCISGACTGSELPFVFNKPMRLDGSSINPNSGEKTLMNEMSRIWFSQALFNNFQYADADSDNVLVIDGEQSFNENTATTYGWDSIANEGIDPKLINGRLTGLENQELMPWQWYLAPNEEEETQE
ncbi:carboxylesterase family protein [Vibrio breoganii]